MTIKQIVIVSIVAILLTWLIYWLNFNFHLGYGISSDPADWGVLGDFLGGVLNPILTFFTIVLLVNSLDLQKESNSHLKQELEKNEKLEKVKSFETRFFNMIDSQKALFERFHIELLDDSGNKVLYKASNAVKEVEDLVSDMISLGAPEAQIKNALKQVDSDDEIFSLVRAFSLIIKTINQKISVEEGFSVSEKQEYYETLINFTNYSQLRLILLSRKYLNYDNISVLREIHFSQVLERLGADVY
ncbi:hypothetical protein [Pseudoalteromonas obscura]|uniref:Phage abortive infection protein n=1 Tax=Pseudoalteromonas obscura TaxID=3048491 RepID=A0ABT7EGR2_9GAMM|nr:hypothetical protein [Pseudoalteromonas sp. P94(2023)]MDK2594232.1 hypothetical protein [Pseudoalteromonas sp. P94(2023)]